MRRVPAFALAALGGVAVALVLARAGVGAAPAFTATGQLQGQSGSCAQLSLHVVGTVDGAQFQSVISASFAADGTLQSATEDMTGAVTAHADRLGATGTCTQSGFSISGTFSTHVSAPDAGDGISTIQVATGKGYTHTYKPSEQPPPPPVTTDEPTTTVVIPPPTTTTAPPPPPSPTTTAPAPPTPRLAARVTSKFAVGKTYTTVKKLSVSGLPRSGVSLACVAKKGCPFASAHLGAPKGSADFTGKLKKAKLRPGARLELRAVSPGMIGAFVRFTMRAHRQPLTARLCLAPGATKPKPC